MNRNIALERIKKSELNEDFLMHEFKYIANKLELTVDELQEIFNGNNKTYKDYNSKKKYFEFEITVHGVYVGRKQSEWIDGIDGHKVIYTPPNKLKESSRAQALKSNLT